MPPLGVMAAIGGVIVLVLVLAVGAVIIIGDRLAVALLPEAPVSRPRRPLSADALHYEPAVVAPHDKQRAVPLPG